LCLVPPVSLSRFDQAGTWSEHQKLTMIPIEARAKAVGKMPEASDVEPLTWWVAELGRPAIDARPVDAKMARDCRRPEPFLMAQSQDLGAIISDRSADVRWSTETLEVEVLR
jgi:hypothetical protein